MLTANEAREKQLQSRSNELLGERYLKSIMINIDFTISNYDRTYIEYYGTINDFAKTKLIENGFKVEPCQDKRPGDRTITGVKISW